MDTIHFEGVAIALGPILKSDQFSSYQLGFAKNEQYYFVKRVNLSDSQLPKWIRRRLMTYYRRKLAHPGLELIRQSKHIVPNHTIRTKSGKFYVISPRTDDYNIYDWLWRLPCWELAELVQMLDHITRAIEFMHSNNWVHGNLRMSNILVGPNQPWSVRITLDRSIKHEIALIQNGRPDILDYCAPEYLEWLVKVDQSHQSGDLPDDRSYKEQFVEHLSNQPRTKEMDCWAVGVIAHIILTGRAPFRTRSVGEMLTLIRSSQPSWAPNLDVQLVDKFGGLLHANIDSRAKLTNPFIDRCWMNKQLKSDTYRRNMKFVIEYDLLATYLRHQQE